MVVAVLVALSVVAVVALTAWRMLSRPHVPQDDVRVLAIVTTVQDDGSRAADLIAYARIVAGKDAVDVVLVPSTLRVRVAGVSDDRLREIYSYGGAAEVRQVFAEHLGVPVDVAVAIDEPQLVSLLGGASSVRVRLARTVDLFRRDRYESFPEGTDLSLTPTDTVDLLAASALSEPPGEDMTMQAALVSAALPVVAPRLAGSRAPAEVDVSGDGRTIRRMQSLLAQAGWPNMALEIAPGRRSVVGERVYFDPEVAYWESRFRRSP